jgi:hypothetical protein
MGIIALTYGQVSVNATRSTVSKQKADMLKC